MGVGAAGLSDGNDANARVTEGIRREADAPEGRAGGISKFVTEWLLTGDAKLTLSYRDS